MSRRKFRLVMAMAAITWVWATSGCGVDTEERAGTVSKPRAEDGAAANAEKAGSGNDAPSPGGSH